MRIPTAHRATGADVWVGCVEGEPVIPAMFPCPACRGASADFRPDCLCGQLWLPLDLEVERIDETTGLVTKMAITAMVRDVELDVAAYAVMIAPALRRIARDTTDADAVVLANVLAFRHREHAPGTLIRRRGHEFDYTPPTGGGGGRKVA